MPDGVASGLRAIKDALRKRRGLARGALFWIEALAAVITIVVVVASLVNHVIAGGDALPREGKRVVAFRQVINRICTEHRSNLRRAVAEARIPLERLGFVVQGLSWDLHDLESITPPRAGAHVLNEELAVRRRARAGILTLQRTIELGDGVGKANAIATLEALQSESRELARESALGPCAKILPSIRSLLQH